MKRLFLALLAPVIISSGMHAQEISSQVIFEKMTSSINNIRTMSFRLDKTERIHGKMMPGSQDVKLNVSPFKTYLKIRVPNKGAEILYIEGTNKGNAKVNPNAFPYMTLNLDPDGGILRKDQHHSVKQLGFGYTGDILKYVYDKYKDKMDEYVVVNGEVTYDSRPCLNVTLDNKEYKIIRYKVQPGEDIISIARRLRLNEYKLLELNGIKDFDDIKEGQEIKIPSSYSKKIEMYLDKQTYLPLYQKMYDEKGLSAVYEYSDLKINPPFTADDFSTENKAYGF